MKTSKPTAQALALPDGPSHSLSVKVPTTTHRAILAYAGRRTAESGSRVTESDVVRAVLMAWASTAEAQR